MHHCADVPRQISLSYIFQMFLLILMFHKAMRVMNFCVFREADLPFFFFFLFYVIPACTPSPGGHAFRILQIFLNLVQNVSKK